MTKGIWITGMLLLMTVALFSVPVSAEAGPVFIFKFHYDSGNITLVDQTVKYGFTPDRKIQPVSGYQFEALSEQNQVLNSFVFQTPNVFIVEGTNEAGELSGGPIILSQTDFALTVAYSPQIRTIRIRDTTGKIVGKIDISKEQEFRFAKLLAFGMLGLAMALTLWMVLRRSRRQA